MCFVVIDVIIVNNATMSVLPEVRANAKLFTTKKYYTREYSQKFSLVANTSSILVYIGSVKQVKSQEFQKGGYIDKQGMGTQSTPQQKFG